MLPAILLALLQAADAAPKPIESLPPLDAEFAVISPDHRRLAFETKTEGLWVLNLSTKQIDLRVPQIGDGVARIAWKPDGSALAVRHSKGLLAVHDAVTGTSLVTVAAPEIGKFVAYAAGGNRIVVSGPSGAEIWPSSGGSRIAQLTTDRERTVTAICVSPDGECLALGDSLGGVSVWTIRTLERVANDTSVPSGVRYTGVVCMAFDPCDQLLAIGSGDCRVRVWKVGTNEPAREFSHCDADLFRNLAIGCVTFNADGTKLLSTAFSFWEARIWDVASGSALAQFDYEGGSPCAMPAWFTSNGDCVTTSLGLYTTRFDKPRSWSIIRPESRSWWQSDGDYAWAVVDHHLVVRKIPEAEPVMRIAVRERECVRATDRLD